MFNLLEGVTARTPTAADAPAVVDAVRASLAELSLWMPWATADYGVVSAERWIDGDFGDRHRFLLFEGDTRVVGCVGINAVDDMHRLGNLGYWVRSDRTGRGYATAATRFMAARGLGEAGLERLEILMAVENEASRRVAEKVGARYEGIARRRVRLGARQHDAHVFSLIASDLHG